MNAEKNLSHKLNLDFEYFITMAMQNKISWDTLLVFLDNLTSTLGKSKELIAVLVKELHKMHLKLQDKDNQEEDTNTLEDRPTKSPEALCSRNFQNVKLRPDYVDI